MFNSVFRLLAPRPTGRWHRSTPADASQAPGYSAFTRARGLGSQPAAASAPQPLAPRGQASRTPRAASDPAAERMRVEAALAQMRSAQPADWCRDERSFVAALQSALDLGLDATAVALPDARQVAADGLDIYRDWVLDHPVWAAVPGACQKWTAARVRGRDDYILHLLQLGVSTASLRSLVARLEACDPPAAKGIVLLLPTYARRGDIEALRWIVATQVPKLAAEERGDIVHAAGFKACQAALQADQPRAFSVLWDVLAPNALGVCEAELLLELAPLAARHCTAGLRMIIARLRAVGATPQLDARHLCDAAIRNGQEAALGVALDALDAATRRALVRSDAFDAPIARALVAANAAAWRALAAELDDPEALRAMLLRHLAAVPRPTPWDTPAQAQATWRKSLVILREAIVHLEGAAPHTQVTPLMLPLAAAAAHMHDVEAVLALGAASASPLWRACVRDAVVPEWIEHGGGLAGLQAILAQLDPSPGEALRRDATNLAKKAVAGGDVATLTWLVAQVCGNNVEQRSHMYTQAINHGASLVGSAARGHTEMVRFWLQSYAGGAHGTQATAYADYAIIEDAAGAGDAEALDLALAHVQDAGALDAVMAARGANAIAFAVQGGHGAMVRKLLALPLHEATRWSILADDNSPIYWVQRGDAASMQALIDWAPASYNRISYDMGMQGAVIAACAYDHLEIARLALRQVSVAGAQITLAAHSGRVVPFAAERGDWVLLQTAVQLADCA